MSDHPSYRIFYFGLLADRRGLSEETITSAAATPAAIYAELIAIHPLGMTPEQLRVAVNDEFAAWDHPLQPGDTMALLPPMSGG
ncbi:MAG: MoaD/ThiS family protein [Verrucomicrobiota bacterium]